MVSSTSSIMTATEERKRTMTMERAKAAHLSRQLQLRLQYARLKVEHGWQNQNLNEVENLYFRHSHTRPRQSPKDPTLITLSVPPATHRSPSVAEVRTTSQSNNIVAEPLETAETKDTPSQPSPACKSPTPQAPPSKSPTPAAPENPPVSSLETSPMAIDSTPAIAAVVQPRSQHIQFSAIPQVTPAHKQGTSESVPTYPITSYYGALFPSQPPSTYGTRYPQIPGVPVPLVTPTHQKAPLAGPQSPPFPASPAVSSSIPVADPFKFGTAATGSLTYDSFWSSHLASRSRASFSALSSDSNKPTIANPLPRRATDIAQALSGYLSTGSTPGGVVQSGNQQPEVSSRV
ncbi:hypothetical protein E1B28_005859 [Marasmius oreades]|uniref:Uncharacterized protein n=1 Tax=Marasmius oreades TaxID=181124 RepID=A0A9P7S441_9AGAR|nr:uncharacterized protein E1B28_005859 [Marasmius oreades]KAG7095069.1 hypothetical protein E1B28_005859 [Marasmius oreades]